MEEGAEQILARRLMPERRQGLIERTAGHLGEQGQLLRDPFQ
jgi:hypothetical protein